MNETTCILFYLFWTRELNSVHTIFFSVFWLFGSVEGVRRHPWCSKFISGFVVRNLWHCARECIECLKLNFRSVTCKVIMQPAIIFLWPLLTRFAAVLILIPCVVLRVLTEVVWPQSGVVQEKDKLINKLKCIQF